MSAVGGLLLCLPCPGGNPPTLRMQFMAVVQTTNVPGKPTVTLTNPRINDRPPHIGFQYRLLDEQNHVFERGFVATFGQKEILLSGCSTPTCLLQAELPHGCVLRTSAPHAYVASRENFLRLKTWSGTLYFYVPGRCETFTVSGCGASPGEGASLRVLDPDGRAVATAGGELQSWDKGRMPVEPGPSGRGRAWSLEVSSAPDLLLDDVHLAVEAGAPPLLAIEPRWAERLGKQMLSWSQDAGPVKPSRQKGGREQ